ncbi:hypothetical protein SEA_BABYDOTZ_90 [Microbacterium phage BabyDotz]|nr:hypothetical protein SEA_BABYDOTZ_90 [Microbacterium phage BabyDotz]
MSEVPLTLTERAAIAVLRERQLSIENGESPLSALGWYMGTSLSYEKALEEIVTKAIEIHDVERKQPVVMATAQHWEVSHVTDESGEWTFLQVVDPASEEDDAQTIVNVSLSDVEAGDLAEALVDRSDVLRLGMPDE